MASSLKKAKVELELLADIVILLMVEKGIRAWMLHATHQYVKANDKYMKYYDKIEESPYLKYWDMNNLYGYGMS